MGISFNFDDKKTQQVQKPGSNIQNGQKLNDSCGNVFNQARKTQRNQMKKQGDVPSVSEIMHRKKIYKWRKDNNHAPFWNFMKNNPNPIIKSADIRDFVEIAIKIYNTNPKKFNLDPKKNINDELANKIDKEITNIHREFRNSLKSQPKVVKKSKFGEESSNTKKILIILLILGVGYYFYKKRRTVGSLFGKRRRR